MFLKIKLQYKILMEIYKDLSNPSSKEFEKLLNNQFQKILLKKEKLLKVK